jgi:hypothetical protein
MQQLRTGAEDNNKGQCKALVGTAQAMSNTFHTACLQTANERKCIRTLKLISPIAVYTQITVPKLLTFTAHTFSETAISKRLKVEHSKISAAWPGMMLKTRKISG